jgi:hypothetical protein
MLYRRTVLRHRSLPQNLIAPDLSAVEPVRKLSRSTRVENTLHITGVGIMTISIVAHVSRSIIESRHLTQPNRLSSIATIITYSLWAGLWLVFAGILRVIEIGDRRPVQSSQLSSSP